MRMEASFQEVKGIELDMKQTDRLVQQLKRKFVDEKQYKKNQEFSESGKTLMWLAFYKEPVVFTYEQLKDFHFFMNDVDYTLYLYDERRHKAYQTNVLNLYEYLETSYRKSRQLDLYVFDHSFDWVYSITHEEFTVLIIGLPGPRRKVHPTK